MEVAGVVDHLHERFSEVTDLSGRGIDETRENTTGVQELVPHRILP